jgi:hypothetical protein
MVLADSHAPQPHEGRDRSGTSKDLANAISETLHNQDFFR